MRSFLLRLLAVAVSVLTACGLEATSQAQTDASRQPDRVTRAKRPHFQPRDWEGIFFDNLLRDGLVGSKPQHAPPSSDAPQANVAMDAPPSDDATDSGAASSGWPRLISGEVLEDEIKRTVLKLAQQVTTPVKFQTDYLQVRQSYSMLSFWFAVIHEYQDSVRWQQQAATVQPAMARAAANARVSSDQSYQYAKARLEELQQLMRGETPTAVEPPVETLEWPYVVDRTAVMIQLQETIDALKAQTSSASEFEANLEDVFHQSQLVAALGQALINPDMDDADDDDYSQHARRMIDDALGALQAARLGNQAEAAAAVNNIEKRCSNCHEDWR